MNIYVKCCLVLFFLSSVTCRSALQEELTVLSVKEFLTKYGYLPERIKGVDYTYTKKAIADGVRRMQAFAGLPQTGEIDEETEKLFKTKRCGVKDIVTTSSNRQKRYIVQQGWDKKTITYSVLNGTSTLEKSRVEALMDAGLAVWAPHGGLTFLKRDTKPDILVSFVNKDHGDGFPFDGPGRVVAHAFPPPHGAMHFDDDELWADNPVDEDEDVTDFFAVAVHEIGHALGLSHSNVKASVMYPYYQVPVEKLHEDDISGMRELYSSVTNENSKEDSEETTEAVVSRSSLVPRFTKADIDEDDIPDLCFTYYDTIQVIQGKIFVFEEEWVWVLTERKQIEEGYPKKFHDVFIGLPKYINVIKTIYEKRNGHIVIFWSNSIINKWNNIRDAFKKSLSKKSGQSLKKNYVYHNQLQFLLKVFTPDETVSSISDFTQDSMSTVDKDSSLSTHYHPGQRKKRMNPVDVEILKILQNTNEVPETKRLIPSDEDEAFLLSILPSIKRLSEDDKIEFRIHVMQLIREYTNRLRMVQHSTPTDMGTTLIVEYENPQASTSAVRSNIVEESETDFENI